MQHRYKKLISAMALTMAGFSGHGYAQSDGALNAVEGGDLVLEEIIVTAQRREQIIIDVPINVAVVNQSAIDNYNLDELEKLSDFVPGLQIQSQSPNIPTYTLRGVVSDGGTPRVAIFHNGVSISDPPSGSNLALHDVDRVEVVKGPQATLFGQGSLVGGINFINNPASTEEDSGYLRLEGGNFGLVRAEGHANLVASDKLAFRFSGLVKNRDGHVENLSDAPDLGGQDQTALRASVHFEPNEKFSGDLVLNYQEDSSTGTPFQSGVISPTGQAVDLFGPIATNITPDQKRNNLGVDREIVSFTSDVEFKLTDSITLTSITDYREIDVLEALDADGTAFNILALTTDDESEAFSQELRINFDTDGRWSGFVGANYFKVDSSNDFLFSTDEAHFQAIFAGAIAAGAGLDVPTIEFLLGQAGLPNAAGFDNPVNPLQFSAAGALLGLGVIPTNPNHLESQLTDTERETIDIFADVTYDFTEKLSITAGLRYTEEELSISGFGRLDRGNPALPGQANSLNFGSTFLVPDDTATGVARARTESPDGDVTWRVNTAYRVSDDLNLWAAIGRGRRPDVLTFNGSNVDVIAAEELDNVEIGLFGRFLDQRLQISSSIYYSEYTNFQTTTFDPVSGLPTVANAGNATQYGLEFDSQYIVSDKITLLATYAYNSSEFDDTDSLGNNIQFAGNTFRLSPENSFSLAADIRIPVSDRGEVSIFPSYSWRSEQFFEDDNSLDFAPNGSGGFNRTPETFFDGRLVNEFQDSYGTFDLKVSYMPISEKWTAYFFIENAFDEEYLIDGGNTGGNIGQQNTFIRNLPRTYGAGVTFNF